MREVDRRKRATGSTVARESAELEGRLRRDLEQRGIGAEQAVVMASRIAPRAAEFSGDAYAAFLDGVAVAHGARREPSDGEATAEIQRLVQDFAGELKKLDEGLRLLSAYLLRIRDRASKERPHTVH